MKIDRLKIKNLYSFEKSEFILDDYNVIVGHNASGKTNIIRILEFLAGPIPESPENQPMSLLDIRLPLDLKFDRLLPSSLEVDLILSHSEIKSLLQMIFLSQTKLQTDKLFKVSLIFNWGHVFMDNAPPDFVFMRFNNGVSVLRGMDAEDHLFLTSKVPDDSSTLPNLLATYQKMNASADLQNRFHNVHGFNNERLLSENAFIEPFLKGEDISRFFNIDGNQLYTSRVFQVRHNPSHPLNHVAEIYSSARVELLHQFTINIWQLMRAMIRGSILALKDFRRPLRELAKFLNDLEEDPNRNWRFEQLTNDFEKLFRSTGFRILRDKTGIPSGAEPTYFIQITEPSGRQVRLDNSASGYFEALSIFSELASREDDILILDEPALHLHPIKIRLLGKIMTNTAGRQIILVTHSPYFINSALFKAGRSLLFVRKNQHGATQVTIKPQMLQLRLKSHTLDPEIFFANVVLLVEGPGDRSAMIAISDNAKTAFDQGDIIVISMGTKTLVEKYSELLNTYQIEHHFMVDNDYKGSIGSLTKLSGTLEDEMKKMGWNSQKSKIDPDEAYEFASATMKSRLNVVKGTELAGVFNDTLKKANLNPSDFW